MAYNEPVLLPIWGRHYARQVGADYCYVIDHGSTESFDPPPGMNVLRLPRSAHDDAQRAGFVSTFVTGLLRYYDWVLYTDVDELVLADPSLFPDLTAFCGSAIECSTVTAIGFDVQHVPEIEPDLDLHATIGSQRGWVRFTSAMCKPVLTRQALSWAPGFHWCEHPTVFAPIYLFHLHWADRSLGMSRLRKTRQMPWATDQYGGHQRIADRAWLDMFQGMADLPRQPTQAFDPADPKLASWLSRTQQSRRQQSGGTPGIDTSLNAAELWPVPSHFRARL